MTCERAADVLRELHYFYPNREKAEAIELAMKALQSAAGIERVYDTPVMDVINIITVYKEEGGST